MTNTIIQHEEEWNGGLNMGRKGTTCQLSLNNNFQDTM